MTCGAESKQFFESWGIQLSYNLKTLQGESCDFAFLKLKIPAFLGCHQWNKHPLTYCGMFGSFVQFRIYFLSKIIPTVYKTPLFQIPLVVAGHAQFGLGRRGLFGLFGAELGKTQRLDLQELHKVPAAQLRDDLRRWFSKVKLQKSGDTTSNDT